MGRIFFHLRNRAPPPPRPIAHFSIFLPATLGCRLFWALAILAPLSFSLSHHITNDGYIFLACSESVPTNTHKFNECEEREQAGKSRSTARKRASEFLLGFVIFYLPAFQEGACHKEMFLVLPQSCEPAIESSENRFGATNPSPREKANPRFLFPPKFYFLPLWLHSVLHLYCTFVHAGAVKTTQGEVAKRVSSYCTSNILLHGNSKRLFPSPSAIHEFNCRASSQGTLQRRSSVYGSLRGKSRLIEFRPRQLHAPPPSRPRPKTRQSPIMKISVKRGTIFFFDRVSEARHHGRRKGERKWVGLTSPL